MSPALPKPPEQAVLTLRNRVAAATLARLEELVSDLLEQAAQEVREYGELAGERLESDVRPLFRAMVLLLIRAAGGGEQRPDSATLELLRERARLQAEDRFPLHAMLLSYSVCMRLSWAYLVEDLAVRAEDHAVAARAVSEMSVAVVRLRETLTGEVADAYIRREREIADSADSVRADVVEQLLGIEAHNPDTLLKRVERMGYRLGEAQAVAVFTIDGLEVLAPGVSDRAERILHEIPDAVRSLVLTCSEPLVQVRHRRLAGVLESSVVAIMPFEGEVSETHLRAAIEGAVGPLDLPSGSQLLVGLGRAEEGVGGAAVSYQQAQRALEAARATRIHSGVVTYTEALPTLILLRDPTLAQDSWLASVQPLFAYDTENATQLVACLSAFLEERGVAAATARRLFIHRHTLTAHLEQIEELTGRSLRDRDDLLMLELGLRAHLFAEENTRRSRHESALERADVQASGELLSREGLTQAQIGLTR
ncbi:MAG TPA: helix-turn-helix domain-containing protein [Solirubrobacteraceae bacterium]|jgi:hypothetical protein